MEEIVKNNKLIAEFMGFKMVVWDHQGINIIKSPTGNTFDLKGLKYNTSWDWLMPVVEKIATLEGVSEVAVKNTGTRIWQRPNGFMQADYQSENEAIIQMCYRTVVRFIKWYNQQPE